MTINKAKLCPKENKVVTCELWLQRQAIRKMQEHNIGTDSMMPLVSFWNLINQTSVQGLYSEV